jgi:DNA invertase Pin-like site-specific DNA recombinase
MAARTALTTPSGEPTRWLNHNSAGSCAELKDQGFGASETAKRLNIGRASVYRVLAS